MTTNHSNQITVTGNVGTDAQLKKTTAKTDIKRVYDPVVDDLVEKAITIPSKPFVTFSIAETRHTPSGTQTIWYSVISWNPNDAVSLLKKGDRVTVRGDFSKRPYSDGSGRSELSIRMSELIVLHTKKTPQAHAEAAEG